MKTIFLLERNIRNASDMIHLLLVKQAFNILWLDFHNWCTIGAVVKKIM